MDKKSTAALRKRVDSYDRQIAELSHYRALRLADAAELEKDINELTERREALWEYWDSRNRSERRK